MTVSDSWLHAVNRVFGTGTLALPPTTTAADSGAEIFARNDAHVILEKSKIIGNWADAEGGGLGLFVSSTATVLHSLSRQSVNGYVAGGAIAVICDLCCDSNIVRKFSSLGRRRGRV